MVPYTVDSDKLVIHYNNNEPGDTSIPETYLEITGLGEDKEVNAVGYTLSHSSGIVMKFANISGLDTSDSISADGIYMILSGALERLELQSTGACHIIVKQVA